MDSVYTYVYMYIHIYVVYTYLWCITIIINKEEVVNFGGPWEKLGGKKMK